MSRETSGGSSEPPDQTIPEVAGAEPEQQVADAFTREMNTYRIQWLSKKLKKRPPSDEISTYLNDSYSPELFQLLNHCPTFLPALVNDLRSLIRTQSEEMMSELGVRRRATFLDEDTILLNNTKLASDLEHLATNNEKLLFKNSVAGLRSDAAQYLVYHREDPTSFLKEKCLMLIAAQYIYCQQAMPDELRKALEGLETSITAITNSMQARIEDELGKLRKSEINKLINEGTHPKFAEQRTTIAIRNLRQELLAQKQQQLAEAERLLPHLSTIIPLLLETNANDHIPLSIKR